MVYVTARLLHSYIEFDWIRDCSCATRSFICSYQIAKFLPPWTWTTSISISFSIQLRCVLLLPLAISIVRLFGFVFFFHISFIFLLSSHYKSQPHEPSGAHFLTLVQLHSHSHSQSHHSIQLHGHTSWMNLVPPNAANVIESVRHSVLGR